MTTNTVTDSDFRLPGTRSDTVTDLGVPYSTDSELRVTHPSKGRISSEP